MNMYPSLTNTRSYVAEKFFTLRTQALRESLWAKLTGQHTSLAIFPEQAPHKSPNRRLIGTSDIPLEQIVGTLNRSSDFDHKFRPLKGYLRDRWVNVYLTVENGDLTPIVVHKVGDGYYVEDGHHRVSVARLLGRTSIEAKVWEYPIQPARKKPCPAEPCAERSSAKAYAV
jgi:hypothetical protein